MQNPLIIEYKKGSWKDLALPLVYCLPGLRCRNNYFWGIHDFHHGALVDQSFVDGILLTNMYPLFFPCIVNKSRNGNSNPVEDLQVSAVCITPMMLQAKRLRPLVGRRKLPEDMILKGIGYTNIPETQSKTYWGSRRKRFMKCWGRAVCDPRRASIGGVPKSIDLTNVSIIS